jgi:uncharacterized protein (TIGR03067 family)
MLALVAAALLDLAGLAVAPPADDPTGDLKKMQGTWETTIQAEEDIALAIEIKGDKFTGTFETADGNQATFEGKIKVDEKADPKQIDFVDFVGPDGSSMPDNLGIYKFESDDELKICTGGHDNPRPKEFKNEGSGGAMTLTLKKSKSKKID